MAPYEIKQGRVTTGILGLGALSIYVAVTQQKRFTLLYVVFLSVFAGWSKTVIEFYGGPEEYEDDDDLYDDVNPNFGRDPLALEYIDE